MLQIATCKQTTSSINEDLQCCGRMSRSTSKVTNCRETNKQSSSPNIQNDSVMQGVKLRPIQAPMRLNFSTLTTKSCKLVAKLATRMFHHDFTKRNSELKRFARLNPRQTSSLSLFPKRSTCISIDN